MAYLLMIGAAAVQAQEPAGWVVVVAATGDDSEAARRASTRALESLQSEGQTVLTGPALEQRVSSAISRVFEPPSAAEQSLLTTTVETVQQQVMYGDDAGTQRSVSATLAELSGRLAALGRDDGNAGRLGDLCLYSVRALLHSRQPDAARRQVGECLRLVAAQLSPSSSVHPGDVRRLVDEERAALARTGARLDVPLGDSGRRCRVRLNGRVVQPGAMLPAGAYQIQVECGDEPGRVHDVTLAPSTPIELDASLEAALGNRDGLELRYASEDTLRQRLPVHVSAIGRALRVANVLVVRDGGRDSLVLERFQIDSGGARRVASAQLALSANENLPPAIEALVAGRSVELSESAGPRGGGAGARPDEAGARDGDGPSLVGPLVLTIAGAGLLGIAVHGIAAGDQCVVADEASPSRCARWEGPSWLGIGVWGGMGLAAIAGAVLWLSLGGSDEAPSVSLGPGSLTVHGAF